MDVQQLIIFLVIGAVAGWLAGLLIKGRGFGLIANIVIGWIGSLIGGFTFSLLGFASAGLLGTIITATVGACLLLAIIGALKKA
jgi:uncharacterized membrane protein YeaQ/YmgE (transglycosylase-associated protein family)